MGKWATLTVLSVVSGCGSDERRSSPLEPGPLPEDSFSLVVSVGEGVVGTPREGTYTYPAGTNISYSYTAIDGYEETLVVLDNTVSLASAGQITVSAPRVLGVLARKIPQIDPEDAAVVQAAGELLSSANTRGAYEAYVREVRRMYEEYGADEGRARALAVSQSVFGVADFAQVQALQAALAGEVFSFADTEGVSQQLTRGADVPVEMIYVNGMFTPEEEGHVAAVELIFLMREMSLPFSMPVKLFYNGSAFRRVREGEYCLITFGLPCIVGAVIDFGESTRQLVSALSRLDTKGEEEARELAELVRLARREGRAVILVGHSQGVLMIDQALRELDAPDECVAAIAVAGPGGSEGWAMHESRLEGLVVSGDSVGDIILNLRLNDFPQLATSLTRHADRALADAQYLPGYRRLVEEWRLHSFLKSYLQAPESRRYIGEAISEQAMELALDGSCNSATPPVTYAVSGRGQGFPPSDLWQVELAAFGTDTFLARIETESGYEPVITDLAYSSSGELWGVSFDMLYNIDASSGTAREVAYFESMTVNAAAFDQRGHLYVAGLDRIMAIDTDNISVVWSGEFSTEHEYSGDIAFSPDGALYAVLKNGSSADVLARVSLETGEVAYICEESLNFVQVWGLVFAGEQLFGLTAGTGSSGGELIAIDVASCSASVIRGLDFRAFGAGASRRW